MDEIQESSVLELLLWLLRLRKRFRVTGASMLPLLEPGQEVLIDRRAYRREPPQPGDIVVAQHPYQPDLKIIKRVTAVSTDGRYFLQGDNPQESSDSRSFGAVSPQLILGRVTSRFP